MPRKKTTLEPTVSTSELTAAPEQQEKKKPVAKAKAKPGAAKTKRKPVEAPVAELAPTLPEPELKASFRKVGRTAVKKAPVKAPEPVTIAETDSEQLVAIFRKPSQDRRRSAPTSDQPSEREARPAARRGRAAKAEPSEPQPEITYDGQRDENDLPIPIWRPFQKAGAGRGRQKAEPRTEDREGETERGGRGRGRRGPEKRQEPVAAAASETEDGLPMPQFRKGGRRGVPKPEEAVVPQKPSRPKIQPKALIPIPSDAPQIVLRDGIPTLVKNSRVYPPIAFFGNCSDERRADTVFEELRLAAEAGVHLHSLLVDLEVNPAGVDHAVSFAGYLMAKAVKVDPQAQVLIRTVFVAPRNWEKEFPDAKYMALHGNVGEPSLSDDKYWGVAKQCLDTFIRKVRMLDTAANVLGVHLERGEWFVPVDGGYDDSNAARVKFKDWVRTRYSDDEVALRASWFDGAVRFDNVQIPTFQPEGAEGDRFVRSSRKQRRYVDYHLFLSDMTVDRIAELAYTTKEASEGYFLAGASYGYTFEWAHPSSGHLALGKLLRTPEIDFIAGPPSYKNREPGGTAPFPSPIDSFALNGKLYISEEDFKTAIGVGVEPDEFNPVIRTPQALESIHWRGVGAALAHASGVSWMDLWGNGWLKTASIWERAAQVREALTTRMAAPLSDPDVAVFVDERALAYLVDPNAFRLLIQNARESAMRSGLSVGFFLLSDLAHRERFPECKLYLFLNAWDIRPELRTAIKERLQRDNKVLFWLYSAGLFDSGRDSLERARDVTGIALKPQPFHSKSGTTILNRKHPLIEALQNRMIPSSGLEPSYFGITEDGVVLGEYTQTGLPSFVVKDFNELAEGGGKWTSVFLGEPSVTPSLIRALGEMAGAHIWNFQDDVIHARPPFLVVHCREPGSRTITLPNKWSAYNLTAKQWITEETSHLRFNATAGSTHVFLVGLHSEIEHLLSIDPETVLTLAGLPERNENTVRFDAVSFDVPIMRLNEWIEGGVTDEVVEELLFRPKFGDEEEAAPEVEESIMPGRRRRQRRRTRGGSEETSSARREGADREFGDLEINVMFRKRE